MWTKMLLSLCATMFFAGCSRTDSPENSQAAADNRVEVVKFSPTHTSNLQTGEVIHITIAYSHTNEGPVLIFAEPYLEGRRVGGFGGAGSPAYPPGTGEALSYFTMLHSPSEVDEVRVFMKDFKTAALLAQTNFPLHVRYD